jgi:HAMP domain-containing protein
MKIATQNLLLIVPIFLLLAVITSLLVFFSEQREVRWGLESEAEGLALTIAEFTDAASLAAVASGDNASAARLREPLARVLAFGQARRIDISAISGSHVRPLLGAGEDHGVRPAFDAEALGRLLQGQVVVTDVAGSHALVAHAPVRDAAGTPAGVVSVMTTLSPVAAHRTMVLRRTASILLALFVMGGLVSLLISVVITSEIGRLARTASAFAAGDYDAALAPGVIEEVAVVGATFGIMGSVLQDTTRRATREMLQFDRFDTEGTLAEFHAARFSAPVVAEHAGLRIAIDRIGPALHGDFWFARGEAGRAHACLGRLDGPPSFDVVLTASAVTALLQDCFARSEDAAQTLLEAARLFPLHCCVWLEWTLESRGQVTVHRLGQDGAVARETLRLDLTRPTALTTLEPNADRQALRYADAYASDTPHGVVDELRRLFGARTQGSVLALQVISS